MSRQGELFSQFGRDHAAQRKLFDNRGPALTGLSCEECGEALERTGSGYICCPNGHGGLREDGPTEDGESNGSWFDE